MLRVACPKCSKSLGLPDTAAGKMVKCPQCQQVFKAPAMPVKIAKPSPQNKPPTDDEATPYGLKEDLPTPEQIKKSAQTEAVDAMVIDAQRVKARNKAWEKVGMPAKFVKRAALTACVIWLCTYLFLTMVIVLAAHNIEQASRSSSGKIMTGGVASDPKYLFIQEVFPGLTPKTLPPLAFWGIVTGGLIVALTIYGLQLAGAESMKKLEGYRLSMFSMIIGALSLNLFAILGLLALMDKGVQYEFRVSKRRLEGKTGEELYREDSDEVEDEEDDEEDDEEEEEDNEEEEVRPARRRK